jgi:hypothetical protein
VWTTEWRAIKQRIGGIREAGVFFLRADTGEDHNSAGEIIGNVHETVQRLVHFNEIYGAVLPTEAYKRVAAFLKRYNDTFGGLYPPGPPKANAYNGAVAVYTYLAAFCAEFDYLISDTSEAIRSLTERAFLHLQRSIVADEAFADKWQRAFSMGELACEKLGAVHLLLHGIWSFKTAASGERTDLVYNEPRIIDTDAQRASVGLVLTEWKAVRNPSELESKTLDAYQQAKRYSHGLLAGLDISATRYLVMISEDRMPMPGPRIETDATYEYRNIAVRPRTPSRS